LISLGIAPPGFCRARTGWQRTPSSGVDCHSLGGLPRCRGRPRGLCPLDPSWRQGLHVWTAREMQAGFQVWRLLIGAIAVMCPAYVLRHVAAGPDGFREQPPNRPAALSAVGGHGVLPFVGPPDHHLPFLSALLHLRRGRLGGLWGGQYRTPVGRAARHHGPDDPGHLVGQSDRRELARLAPQQFQQPG